MLRHKFARFGHFIFNDNIDADFVKPSNCINVFHSHSLNAII